MSLQAEAEKHFKFKGQVAFVPGGSGDLGKAIVYGLCAQGIKTVVAARNVEKCQDMVDHIRARGGEAMALALDVHSVSQDSRRGRRGGG
jgi:NAD(P)-dependent dehydrogenase (short-subunit alcohol dehydrogenase family)